ncbi:MAG: hypothetical protein GY917_15865 [Planctomycetaceae bacterium]|nr:hypothetical protein [Planctomycetaceae bacterium]MCP4811805.1 hypothetical protein [Planctomycetaceae bacterium]
MSRFCLRLLVVWFLVPSAVSAQVRQTEKLLTRIQEPPTYVRNENYERKWFETVKTGIDKTRDYLGNYGPVQVYIIGQKTNELEDPQVAQAIVEAYCRRRQGKQGERLSDCLKRSGASLIERGKKGSTEAYLSYVNQTDPPLAELVFINPHGFPFPYLYTRGIHEYTHVFQRAFPRTPTWMTEGGAEFLAFYLGDQYKWIDFEQSMNKSMRMVQSVGDEATMKDFEDVERLEKEQPELKKYYRHLAYDAGVWAVAFAIHRSKTRSVKTYTQEFYPLVASLGWEEALGRYAQVADVDDFYERFAKFLEEPIGAQMKMLAALKP